MPVPDRTAQLVSRAKPLAPLLVILAAIGAGQLRGLGMALLVLAGGMLLMAIAMLWGSIQSLDDEEGLSLDEALVLGAPSAEEEKKRAVLRALKDLEYERSVGKVTEDDYAKLAARYRDEAKRLLRILETEELPARERAEKLLARRLERAGFDRDSEANDDEPEKKAPAAKPSEEEQPAAPARASDDQDDEDEDDDPAKSDGDDEHAEEADDEEDDEDAEDDDADSSRLRQCEKCETWNDQDARFCKHCGGPMT